MSHDQRTTVIIEQLTINIEAYQVGLDRLDLSSYLPDYAQPARALPPAHQITTTNYGLKTVYQCSCGAMLIDDNARKRHTKKYKLDHRYLMNGRDVNMNADDESE